MSTLLRNNIKIMKHVPRVIFNNYLPVTTNFQIPLKKMKAEIPDARERLNFFREELTDNLINDSIKQSLNYIESNQLSRNKFLIEKYFENTSNNHEKQIKKDIMENTHFENDEWNITNLARKYNLDGKDVFLAMVTDNVPDLDTLGPLDHKEGGNSKEVLEAEWNERKSFMEDYVCFDWLNGIGIKNNFPVNINKSEFDLNMRRFNDRNNDIGYERLFNLLSSRISSGNINNNFTRIEPEDKTQFNSHNYHDNEINFISRNENTNPRLNKKLIKDHHLEIELFDPGATKHSKLGHSGRYYNRRNGYGHDHLDYSLFPKDIKDEFHLNDSENATLRDNLETYYCFVKDRRSRGLFNLDNYFYLSKRYNKMSLDESYLKKDIDEMENSNDYYSLNAYRHTQMKNLSIVNCLVFGNTNVRPRDLGRLLGMVRYGHNYEGDITYLDNYAFHGIFRWNGDQSMYLQVEFDSDKLNQLKFHKDEKDKLKIAEKILQVMNETNPDMVNHHNYNALVNYVNSNHLLHEIDILTSSEEIRIKNLNFEE